MATGFASGWHNVYGSGDAEISLSMNPSLQQQLQNCSRYGQGTHSLLDWPMVAFRMVCANVGDIPRMISKWHFYAELVQVLQELDMQKTMFNLNDQGLIMKGLWQVWTTCCRVLPFPCLEHFW